MVTWSSGDVICVHNAIDRAASVVFGDLPLLCHFSIFPRACDVCMLHRKLSCRTLSAFAQSKSCSQLPHHDLCYHIDLHRYLTRKALMLIL